MDHFKLNLEGNHATLAGHTFVMNYVGTCNGVLVRLMRIKETYYWAGMSTSATNVYDTTLAMRKLSKMGA